MYRLTYNLGKVGNYMTLKVFVTIKDDEYKAITKNNPKYFNLFKFMGNEYFTVNLIPCLMIDITNPLIIQEEKSNPNMKKEYDPGRRINLSKFGIFWLMKILKKVRQDFLTNKDLFYYYNGVLKLNPSLSQQVTSKFTLPNNRSIIVIPTIIQDDNNGSNTILYHEGVNFCIDNTDNFCPLSISEIDYLIYLLDNLNLETVTDILLLSEDKYRPKAQKLNNNPDTVSPYNFSGYASPPN